VLFSQVVQQLLEQEHTIFIEVSPHPILLSSLQQCFDAAGRDAVGIATLQREMDERETLLQSLALLYTLGAPIRWASLYADTHRRAQLPAYPWQRQSFWLPFHREKDGAAREVAATSLYPFVQQRWQSALHSDHVYISAQIDTQSFPYLADHCVGDLIILPATVYLETALEAARTVLGEGSYELLQVEIVEALPLSTTEAQTIQVVLSPLSTEQTSFQFFSLAADVSGTQQSWHRHAEGIIQHIPVLAEPVLPVAPALVLADLQKSCGEQCGEHDHYQALRQRRVQYGPAFQGVTHVWQGQQAALALIQATEQVISDSHTYVMHPAWLDACMQTVFDAMPTTINGERITKHDCYVPIALQRLRMHARAFSYHDAVWSYAALRPTQDARMLVGDITLFDAQGCVLLEVNGLVLRRNERDLQQDYLYTLAWSAEALPAQSQREALLSANRRPCLLFAREGDTDLLLATLLCERGHDCIVVTPGSVYRQLSSQHYQVNPIDAEHLARLFAELATHDTGAYEVLYLWNLQWELSPTCSTETLTQTYLTTCEQALTLMQALINLPSVPIACLWLLTAGAHAVLPERDHVACVQAALWGLRRVLQNEHPDIHCRAVDLSATPSLHELHALVEEIQSSHVHEEIALRGEARYVHRLTQGRGDQPQILPSDVVEKRASGTEDEPFVLTIQTPGMPDTLQFQRRARRSPGPGEVELQVYASALNFRDVLSALGMYPGYPEGVAPFGIECAGVVTAVGADVTTIEVGAEVMAIGTHTIGAYVTTDAHFVITKPAHLSFAAAATMPIAFVTATYALIDVGRLKRGERVLIHSAAGGVGLAALQLSQLVGAEVFATAGTPEKREYLRSLGVAHVMDSRSLAFAAEIMQQTNGEGVDVVLNSLTGPYIQKGLAVLKDCGRFLELGKRDIYQDGHLSLAAFRKNLSYITIDIDLFLRERSALLAELLTSLSRALEEQAIRPLPYQAFPLATVADAFRLLMQGRHIGKIVLAHHEQGGFVRPPLVAAAAADRPLCEHATYLLTGGLGGIGIALAQWLATQGARQLVLVGRSAPSTEARRVIAALEATGVRVIVMQADLACEADVAQIFSHICTHVPPLKGIVHAAAVLDDGMLTQLNRERFATVMAPKVRGAWNLHQQTLHMALDFFVCFSSAATIVAPPGQGNYIAANAFLDALAHHRRALGLPALSLNWGPWSDAGFLVTRPELGKHFEDRGLEPLPARTALALFGQVFLQRTSAQLGVMAIDWSRWQQFYPLACASSLVRHLLLSDEKIVSVSQSPAQEEKPAFSLERLRAAAPTQQQAQLELYLLAQFAAIRGVDVTQLSTQAPLMQQGLDSLMAVELRNRIQRDLQISLLMKNLLGKATIQHVVQHLARALVAEKVPVSASLSAKKYTLLTLPEKIN
jgi:NADPH:quinone reductase-like Zn-dependent oxidoreductase/aryl carrier-like protein